MKRIPTTRLVMKREIEERLQSRLIRAMTAFTALGVVLIIVIPAIVRQPAKPTVVGLVGSSAQALGPTLRRAATEARVEVRIVDVASAEAARTEVRDGTLAIALSVGEHSAVAEVKETLSPTIAALLRSTLNLAHLDQVLGEAGVPPPAVRRALTPVPFSTTALQPPPPDRAARSVAALAAGLLLYLSLGLYAAAVANGVAQEKTSRTAEVLLAAVRPRQLMTGKVVGIGLVGLGQLAVAVAAGLVANAVVHRAEIPSTVWLLLPSILVWFVLGFALYSFAYAAAAATVARQEEVQFVTLPIGLPLIAGFLLTYAAIASPSAWWIRLLSFLPPLTPILMPARIALGHVAGWEIALAVLIMLASIYGTARLAARIYAGAIVRGGARLGWRAALRLEQGRYERQSREVH
jgi:ABC-2 type transport system permease protein